ncbi:DEAD/DEAH box helicase [Balneola vulgaris]|uniref:DEAD/DEAH box helicase n=1 Tax=Balneola vulgaris TaxID=287535 RepID=UPI00035CC300|nr:DEAD/DEAH box helicase family protein [Balneola vulgaris]
MALIDLLSNIPSSIKTQILGSETTKILRYTFANKNGVLEDDILNEALILQCGTHFFHRKKLRELIIACIPKEELSYFNTSSHSELESHVLNNKDRYADLLGIEQEFRLKMPVDERSNIEFSVPIYGENNGVKAYPHEYQLKLKKRVSDSLQNEMNPKILLTLPTGSGKTVLAMEAIIDIFRNRKFSEAPQILWLVSTKELAEQSLNSFLQFWKQKGDHKVIARRYFGNFNTIEPTSSSCITFATYDLMINRLDDKKLKKYMGNCDFMFIDEAHYSQAEVYNKVIRLYCDTNKYARILALTATPFRTDLNEFSGFKKYFKSLVQLDDVMNTDGLSPIQYLQEGKYLSKLQTTNIYEKYAHQRNEEYYKELHDRVLDVCKSVIDHKENMIIFAETKSHAVALSIYLSKKNIQNGLIVGETPDIRRKDLLSKFGDKENELNILINHGILATGIDVPGMNAIMILREIESPSLALQIVGRAMRGPKNGGNEINDVYLTQNNFNYLSKYNIIEDIVLTK